MKKSEVTITLNREELLLLHNAVCNYRAKVGNLMGNLAEVGLATEEIQQLWNQLGALSQRIGSASESPA